MTHQAETSPPLALSQTIQGTDTSNEMTSETYETCEIDEMASALGTPRHEATMSDTPSHGGLIGETVGANATAGTGNHIKIITAERVGEAGNHTKNCTEMVVAENMLKADGIAASEKGEARTIMMARRGSERCHEMATEEVTGAAIYPGEMTTTTDAGVGPSCGNVTWVAGRRTWDGRRNQCGIGMTTGQPARPCVHRMGHRR